MAHMAMANTHQIPIGSLGVLTTPPRIATRRCSASAPGPWTSSNECSNVGGGMLRQSCSRRPRLGLGMVVLLPHHHIAAPRRDASAGSTQTRHFHMTFDPSKSNIPGEYNFTQPMDVPALLRAREDGEIAVQPFTPASVAQAQASGADAAAVVDVGPYVEFDPADGHVANSYWRGPAPEGSFMVRNAIAQRARLTPLRVPESGAGSASSNPLAHILRPFPKEEYYAVEMDLNYGREWPRFVWENGTFGFRPGFLTPWVDPDFAPYWLHRGLARFQFSAADRAVQTLVGGLYLAVLAAAAAALAAVNPHLLAALAVSWARNSLSLAKWAGLLFLAATDRLFLYWVLLAGKLVDGVLARHAPPVRNFCWGNLALYGAYVLLTPADWTLAPGLGLRV